MTRILLIDDMRSNYNESVIARSYLEGIKCLQALGSWDKLLLDHDLASFDDDGKEFTGYDILLFLEENPWLAPKEIEMVSSNSSIYTKCTQAITSIMKRRKEFLV